MFPPSRHPTTRKLNNLPVLFYPNGLIVAYVSIKAEQPSGIGSASPCGPSGSPCMCMSCVAGQSDQAVLVIPPVVIAYMSHSASWWIRLWFFVLWWNFASAFQLLGSAWSVPNRHCNCCSHAVPAPKFFFLLFYCLFKLVGEYCFVCVCVADMFSWPEQGFPCDQAGDACAPFSQKGKEDNSCAGNQGNHSPSCRVRPLRASCVGSDQDRHRSHHQARSEVRQEAPRHPQEGEGKA